jgi:D-alanyl-D-alanine carboxypeptidase
MDRFLIQLRTSVLFLGLLLGFQGSANANDTAVILYDYDAGRVLYEKNADEIHYPASLTKMMTLYLTFQALSKEQFAAQSQFPVSYNASMQEPSKLGLLPGQYVSIGNLAIGVATNSSNDAATVLAEGIGGNIRSFSEMMNQQAQQLDMLNTYYENPTGLPNPNQVTTARAMLKLAIALYRDFPEYYGIFSTRHFNYHGRQYKNHNHLLYNYTGVDGIKTGYIRAEGYNLVGSANRDGRRLLAVVLGGKTAQTRDHLMRHLLDRGFDNSTDFSETPSAEAPVETAEKPISKPASKPVSKLVKHKHHAKKHVKKVKAAHHAKKSGKHKRKKR